MEQPHNKSSHSLLEEYETETALLKNLILQYREIKELFDALKSAVSYKKETIALLKADIERAKP